VIYLCVDGGQTKTAAALLDQEGALLESWQEEPLTHPSTPEGLERLHRVARKTCQEMARRLQPRSPGAPLSVCFSLTGYHEGDRRIPDVVGKEVRRILPHVEEVRAIPDYVGNWFAVTGGAPGIVVVSGGGSVAYGRDGAGNSLRVGGWGHAFGDEGSGYWIGLEAVKAALKSRVGLTPKTALAHEVMVSLRAANELDLLNKVYSGALPERTFTSLVPLVVSLAGRGDEVADRILDGAANHLARMGVAVLEGLGALPVHPSGGVFRAVTMTQRFENRLSKLVEGVEVTTTTPAAPTNGVFLAARREELVACPPQTVELCSEAKG
jgi:N-acetylglucosamine kinase-like BadF-type ATPase